MFTLCIGILRNINDALYQWYLLACSKTFTAVGPSLLKKPAIRLDKECNGWLEKRKKRYNIRGVAVCGESGDVRGDTAESWKERLPEILSGHTYAMGDIYNLDETGCFWSPLPEQDLAGRGRSARVGRA